MLINKIFSCFLSQNQLSKQAIKHCYITPDCYFVALIMFIEFDD